MRQTKSAELFMQTGEWSEFVLPDDFHPGYCATCGHVLDGIGLDGCCDRSCPRFAADEAERIRKYGEGTIHICDARCREET